MQFIYLFILLLKITEISGTNIDDREHYRKTLLYTVFQSQFQRIMKVEVHGQCKTNNI